jgi:hypothetical protein
VKVGSRRTSPRSEKRLKPDHRPTQGPDQDSGCGPRRRPQGPPCHGRLGPWPPRKGRPRIRPGGSYADTLGPPAPGNVAGCQLAGLVSL